MVLLCRFVRPHRGGCDGWACVDDPTIFPVQAKEAELRVHDLEMIIEVQDENAALKIRIAENEQRLTDVIGSWCRPMLPEVVVRYRHVVLGQAVIIVRSTAFSQHFPC